MHHAAAGRFLRGRAPSRARLDAAASCARTRREHRSADRRGPAPRREAQTYPKLQQQLERLSALPKPKQRAVMEVLEAMLAQASR
jgi:hypothetical protein